jgi:hypothetical protein
MTESTSTINTDLNVNEKLTEMPLKHQFVFWCLHYMANESNLVELNSKRIKAKLFALNNTIGVATIEAAIIEMLKLGLVSLLVNENAKEYLWFDGPFYKAIKPKPIDSNLVFIKLDQSRQLSTKAARGKPKGAIPQFEIFSDYLTKVTCELQETWLKIYGDPKWIMKQIQLAIAWEQANATKVKSNKGSFINNWLANARLREPQAKSRKVHDVFAD